MQDLKLNIKHYFKFSFEASMETKFENHTILSKSQIVQSLVHATEQIDKMHLAFAPFMEKPQFKELIKSAGAEIADMINESDCYKTYKEK